MKKKLTLDLDASVIERAEEYAQSHHTSLSKLVESYLSSLIENRPKDIEITPLVKRLSGVVEISSDFKYKNEYAEYLLEKYK